MTKPRFTPDPLPDGLDPTLASYLQRQFDRIDDWWPKDLEDRVKALEEIASGIGGVWPVIDYSAISFTGEAVEQYEFTCFGESTVISDHAFKASNNTFEYSTETNSLWYLVGSSVSTEDRYPAIAKYSFDSNSASEWDWTSFDANGGFGYLKMLDEYGSIGGGKFLYGDITKSDGWDYFVVFSIASGTPTKVFEARHNGTAYSPAKVVIAETENQFLLIHDAVPNTEFYKMQINTKYPSINVFGPGDPKEGWLSNTDITLPTNYSNLNAGACDASNSTFLIISKNNTENKVSTFIHNGSSLSGVIESFEYTSPQVTTICASGIRVGTYCYFLVNYGTVGLMRIKTDGTNINVFNASSGTTSSFRNRNIYYSAELNGILFIDPPNIYFYSIEEEMFTQCPIEAAAGYTGTYRINYTMGGFFKDGKYYALNGYNDRDSDDAYRLTVHSVEI